MSLLELTAVELAKEIKAGKTTAVEAMKAVLEQIEKTEETYHCYITIDKEKAILVLDTAKTFFENEEDFSLENSKKLEEDIYAKFQELGFHMGGSFRSVKNCSNGKSCDSTIY